MTLPNCTTTSKQIALYIGRFQPLHKGHHATIQAALSEFNELIILIGSSQESRTCKNPWSYIERKRMIEQTLTHAQKARVHILKLPDFPTDRKWVKYTYRITNLFLSHFFEKEQPWQVTLIGYPKDQSSYYLELLPWPFKEFKNKKLITISSTFIRKKYFSNDSSYQENVPYALISWLERFKCSHACLFKKLKRTC